MGIMMMIGVAMGAMLLCGVVEAQVATPPAPPPLDLTCAGGGSASRTVTSNAYAYDDRGGYGSATMTQRGSEGFADQVDVHIEAGGGRIRLPRTMLPPVHGGDGGWFKLSGVVVDDDRIAGSASVNPLNHPKVVIDRKTGGISIDGKSGHYHGRCERRSADAPNRF